MAQLGSGNGSSYPHAIDTRQTFQNSPMAAPDSASRMDAEVLNDLLAMAVAIETCLGANPQGVSGSVAARLQQYLPGGGTTPLSFAFANQTSVVISGNAHRLGTANLLIQVYDTSVPRVSIQPQQVSIDQLTYDVTITFATPQSGLILLAAAAPQYTTSFTSQTSVSIPGTTHQLGTGELLSSVYVASGSIHTVAPATVTVNQTNFNTVVTFQTAQSGSIMLSAAGPRHVASFSNQTSVTIAGNTHGLGSDALLYQIYNAATPAAQITPNNVTVDPSNFAVTVTFLTPQSGFIVLVKASEISGTDFQIQDGGITNSTATRVYSESGVLTLQMGSGNTLRVLNKAGMQRMTITDAGNVGIGTTTPSYQLQLTGEAAKPSSAWIVPCDEELKEDIRPFIDGLAQLMRVEPIWFRYTGEGGMPNDRITKQERVGLSAQALQEVMPHMVQRAPAPLRGGGGSREFLTYDASSMPFVLINAVKELAARVEALEAALLEKDAS